MPCVDWDSFLKMFWVTEGSLLSFCWNLKHLLSEKSLISPEQLNHNRDHGGGNKGSTPKFRARTLANHPADLQMLAGVKKCLQNTYPSQYLTCPIQSVLFWSLYQVTVSFANTSWKQKSQTAFWQRTSHLHTLIRLISPELTDFRNNFQLIPRNDHKRNSLKKKMSIKTQQGKLYL